MRLDSPVFLVFVDRLAVIDALRNTSDLRAHALLGRVEKEVEMALERFNRVALAQLTEPS